MNNYKKPFRAYIVIIDIVGFSDRNSDEQAECVSEFLSGLKKSLKILDGFDFSIYSIGDGVIVSINEKDYKREIIAEKPILLAKEVMKNRGNIELRISINYSDVERMVPVGGIGLDTSSIQIGNGINIAERIIRFCEQNEIIVSRRYYDLLLEFGYSREYKFFPCGRVFVKHMKDVEIFSYTPKEDEFMIYKLPSETFKKYAYFPPIKGEVFRIFEKIGLENDLHNLSDISYKTIAAINKKKNYISLDPILEVLMKIHTEEEDNVYVISRSDLEKDFWDQQEEEINDYLNYMENNSKKYDVKYHRVFIEREDTPLIDDLKKIHSRGTIQRIDKKSIRNYKLLKYRFGITIYPKLLCAISPIPLPKYYRNYIKLITHSANPEDIFDRAADIDFSEPIFKAFVIADKDEVSDLVDEFKSLLQEPMIEEIY